MKALEETLSPQSWGGTDDVIIVGGGLAGLFCALKLSPRPVTIVTAAPIGEGASTAWAQGGIAAAVADGDSPEAHARDTIAAGAGLVDQETARAMTREAPERVRDLVGYGVVFDRDSEGRLLLAQEAAHGARRIVHVRGDAAGQAIMTALVAAVRATPSIRLLANLRAEALLVEGIEVSGVRARALTTGRDVTMRAGAVVLATGGIGHLYAVTTNPPAAQGHGLAMAARAGAIIADAEFVQFHPTAIAISRDPAPLATEALRGEGAILINRLGERFMRARHADAELAPRDVVARGVFEELRAGRGAFLDARAAVGTAFAERFPTVFASCMAHGIDPGRQPIPVAPAAHYHMGGVRIDATGRTSLSRLWAAGEAASSGAHGANRLASNSLLESVVYAARVAADIVAFRTRRPTSSVQTQDAAPAPGRADVRARERDLRALMSAQVGVIRSRDGLARALRELAAIEREAGSPAMRNMALAALMVATAAYRREESRGAHFRADCPRTDPAQATRGFLTYDQALSIAESAASQQPVAVTS